MAENTLQKRENKNHNNRENNFQKILFTKLSKTVMQNVLPEMTSNLSDKKKSITYFSKYNMLTQLLPYIYLVIFWTLCQYKIGVVSTSSVSDPMISAVHYVGYLKKESVERTTISDDATENFHLPNSIDILIKVKGINIENIENWKVTQNERLCNDNITTVSKTKYVSVMSFEGQPEIVEVLLTIPVVDSTENSWFLCGQNRTNDDKLSKKENSDMNWLHLGQFSNFRLPNDKDRTDDDNMMQSEENRRKGMHLLYSYVTSTTSSV